MVVKEILKQSRRGFLGRSLLPFNMVVYSVYVISKSGGLIFHYDHVTHATEVEKTFSYPLDLKMDYLNQRIAVTFGQRDGIKVGYALLAVNGDAVSGRKANDRDVLSEILPDEANFPINLKFGIPKLTANEKIVLASMFHSTYAIAALQIAGGRQKDGGKGKSLSSGIEVLETENFRLNCYQTPTGVKFVVISDLSQGSNLRETLLKKIYELYTDYVLKNPFYSLDMPIRCELFESNLKILLEQHEKTVINA